MSAKATVKKQTAVFELVGPAGAGKTSLLKEVAERDSSIRAGLRLRRLSHLPTLITTTIVLLPTLLSYVLSSRRFDWLNIKRMVLLTAFSRLLRRQASKNCRAVVLDEGPVFMLTWLHAFARESSDNRRLRKWSEKITAQWAGTLDAIIWLDAPDAVLAERIRSRMKPHRVKEKTDGEIYEFLNHYRASYEQVIAKLEIAQGPKVIRISTSEKSLDLIADEVISQVPFGSNQTSAVGTIEVADQITINQDAVAKRGKGLTEKAFLNAISSFLDYAVKIAVTLVITPIMVSRLGSSLYGVWQMLGRMVAYMHAADGRPTQALKWIIANQQAIDDDEAKRRHVGSALGVWLMFFPVIAIAGGLLIWLAPSITKVQPELYFAVRFTCALLVLDFLLANLITLPESVLRGMNLGYKRMGVVASLNVVGGALTVAALYMGTGLIGIAAAQVALSILTGILFWMLVKKYVAWFGVARPSMKEIRAFFGLSAWYFAWTLISKLLLASDVIVLGVLVSTTTVAIYSLSAYAGRTLLSIITMILASVAPGLGGVIGQRKFDKAAALRGEMMAISWLFATAIGSTILLCNRSFVSLWVGSDYYAGAAVDLLVVLMVAQYVFVRNDTYVIDLTLQMRQKVIMGAVSVALSIALSYFLIPPFGIAGLCAGMFIGRLVLSVSYPLLVNRYLERKERLQLKLMARPALATALLFAVSSYFSQSLLAASWLEWLAVVSASFALAFSVAFVIGLSRDSRKKLIARARIIQPFKRR